MHSRILSVLLGFALAAAILVPHVFGFSTTPGTDDAAGGARAFVGASTKKLLCSQAPGFTLNLPNTSGARVDPCATVNITASDLCNGGANGIMCLDSNTHLNAPVVNVDGEPGAGSGGADSIHRAVVIGGSATPYGLISLQSSVTGNYDGLSRYGFRGLEDVTNINMTGTQNAYVSVASSPSITGTSDYESYRGILAWPSFGSTGTVGGMTGVDVKMIHGSGTVESMRGIHIGGSGTGDVVDNVAIYIDDISGGQNSNFAIYSEGGANYFGGSMQVGSSSGQSGVDAYGVLRARGLSDGSATVREAIVVGGGTTGIYGQISLSQNITGNYHVGGPYGFHGLEDHNSIDMTGDVNAYASLASSPVVGGSSNYDHFKAGQFWPTYASSGNIGALFGLDILTTQGGPGTATVNYGIYINKPGGSGVIGTNYGIYLDDQNRGSSNSYSIYSNTTAPSYFGGRMGIGTAPDVRGQLAVANTLFISSAQMQIGDGGIIGGGSASGNSMISFYPGKKLSIASGGSEVASIDGSGQLSTAVPKSQPIAAVGKFYFVTGTGTATATTTAVTSLGNVTGMGCLP